MSEKSSAKKQEDQYHEKKGMIVVQQQEMRLRTGRILPGLIGLEKQLVNVETARREGVQGGHQGNVEEGGHGGGGNDHQEKIEGGGQVGGGQGNQEIDVDELTGLFQSLNLGGEKSEFGEDHEVQETDHQGNDLQPVYKAIQPVYEAVPINNYGYGIAEDEEDDDGEDEILNRLHILDALVGFKYVNGKFPVNFTMPIFVPIIYVLVLPYLRLNIKFPSSEHSILWEI